MIEVPSARILFIHKSANLAFSPPSSYNTGIRLLPISMLVRETMARIHRSLMQRASVTCSLPMAMLVLRRASSLPMAMLLPRRASLMCLMWIVMMWIPIMTWRRFKLWIYGMVEHGANFEIRVVTWTWRLIQRERELLAGTGVIRVWLGRYCDAVFK